MINLNIQSAMAYITFAAASKLLAGTATYPWILIRTRMQDHFQDYKGILDVLHQTRRYNNISSKYKQEMCCNLFLFWG